MIQAIKKTFWFPFSTKKQIEKYQKEIRDIEWNSFKSYISKNARFLDVGCGSGDNLLKAQIELDCQVTGIDPNPGAHGVGRFEENREKINTILQGNAETLPFENEIFDVVFCSHVLEHVNNQDKSIQEMKRVLKQDGVLIIGMPTSSMAFIAFISHYLFTLHVNLLFLMKNFRKKEMFNRLVNIFIPSSHSIPNHRFIYYDLWNYRITKWKKVVSKEFRIIETITPCLYPYPDYIQWFPKMKLKGFSSSVFFICRKK